MMRSLFSGVAGLKTHQTRMDVIGNNIANVNTTAYKSQSMTFSDIMYQTTQNASGASERLGGVNARQIGLGVQTSAISTAIDQQGASQTTNNPFDIMISGDAFFVVNNGQEQLYTRDGSFYLDGVGNLAMQSNGYLVQGWGAYQDENGAYQVDVNSGIGRLQLMNAENTTYPAAATTKSVMTGNIDQNDSNVKAAAGRTMTLEFYDDRGYLYTARFSVKQMKNADGTPMTTSNMNPLPASMEEPMKTQMDKYYDVGKTGITPKNEPMYTITLTDILDSDNQSIGIDRLNAADPLGGVTFGESHVWNRNLVSGKVASDITNAAVDDYSTEPATSIPANAFASATDSATARSLQELKSSATIVNDGGKTVSGPLAGVGGEFFGMSDAEIDSYGKDATYYFSGGKLYISSENKTSIVTFDPDTGAITAGSNMTMKFTNDPPRGLESFKNIEVDATTLTNINTNGSSTFKATKGDMDGNNTGRMVGTMNGISVEVTGKIWASYSNGQTKLLGQIATAEFANASGLEKGGDNLYRQTNNSGDATIQEIEASGGKMNTGVLEMSNVDLSSEFTTMITTQRGFQANSRIITVSDTLLEELTNLKR